MLSWCRTEDGWAVNLDGTSAAQQFTLPRIEIHSGPRGWTCACHLGNGTSRLVSLGHPASATAAMRAGIEGSLVAVGEQYATALLGLLGAPGSA